MSTVILHPMIVHFPIALIITGFLFAIIPFFCKKCDAEQPSCLTKIGFYLLSLGALGAIAALASGHLFTKEMVGIMGEMRSEHANLALITTIVSTIGAAIYGYYIYSAKHSRKVLYTAFFVYIAAAILVAITGHMGGAMVFGF